MLVNYSILLVAVSSFVYSLEENPKIIIVGAGSSAIAAATKLWKANFTNLQILEAEPRIGGRINSVTFGDTYVDLGAAWCHGEEDNIVYNMAKKYLKHSNMENTKLIYSNGSRLDEEIIESLTKYAESIDPSGSPKFSSSIDDFKISINCEGVASIGACFDKTIKATFRQKYQNDVNKLTVILEAAHWLWFYMLGSSSSSTQYDVYIDSDYVICEGDYFLNWNGLGYKTILELMMQKFPDPSQQLPIDSKILLNKEVTRIIWNSEETKVLVECQDNSSYQADHVIFTPSLGVLKEKYQTMFQPSLPEDKIKAITNTGFGTILKIILHFPRTWWELDGIYGFIWSTEDRNRIISEFGKGPIKNGRSWLTTAIFIITANDNPKVLTIMFTGDMVLEIEKEDNQVLKDGCFYMLKKFLGKNRTTIEPDDILKTTWYNNPHFRGTYTYDSIQGNTVQHKFPDKLASPLMSQDGRPVVQFAGEATHPRYYGMVHGSIETGFREADRIIDLYAKE